MVRIAVVEDDPMYVGQLKEYLERYGSERGEKLAITCFADGDEIALHYTANYDVILMDVEMTFMDGMTAAEEIRKKDSAVVIIFITNSPRYAIQGYAVDALDYVLKPLSYYAFSQRIDRAMARIRGRKQCFVCVNSREGSWKLDQARITYVEMAGRELIYHTLDGPVQAKGTLRDAEQALDGKRFFRCNKGYLINLEQVDGMRGDDAVVAGQQVQISRSKRKAFLDALNNYLGEVGK